MNSEEQKILHNTYSISSLDKAILLKTADSKHLAPEEIFAIFPTKIYDRPIPEIDLTLLKYANTNHFPKLVLDYLGFKKYYK